MVSFFNWKESPRKAVIIKRYSKGNILNVGCGNMYLRDSVNLDTNPKKQTDILSDFHLLPFKDNTFDVVFALDIVEHSDTPQSLIKELERVCNDNGNIVIETADFDVIPENWIADDDHKTYINRQIFIKFFGNNYALFTMGKEMLLAVKKPKLLDWALYRLLTLLVSTYKLLTMQPKNRATHWR